MIFYETSALTGDNIEYGMRIICDIASDKHESLDVYNKPINIELNDINDNDNIQSNNSLCSCNYSL